MCSNKLALCDASSLEHRQARVIQYRCRFFPSALPIRSRHRRCAQPYSRSTATMQLWRRSALLLSDSLYSGCAATRTAVCRQANAWTHLNSMHRASWMAGASLLPLSDEQISRLDRSTLLNTGRANQAASTTKMTRVQSLVVLHIGSVCCCVHASVLQN